MNPGAYKEKIEIKKAKYVVDEIGNQTKAMETIRKCYCYVNNLSGKEYWEAAKANAENTVQFIMRYNPFFEEVNEIDCIILFKGREYDIKTIDNVQYKNETIKIRAVTKDIQSEN